MRRPSLAFLALTGLASFATADLTVLGVFDPAHLGNLCGIAVDPVTGDVWLYECFGPVVQRYSSTGTFLSEVFRAGEAANDVDIEIIPEAMNLGGTVIPAGTLLFINGEMGVAEVYAIDPASGAVLSTLTTAFGASHVVGGALHRSRDTLFLIQDGIPFGPLANLVAEIDPVTGAVLGSFQTSGAGFEITYGDLDVSVGGNLLVVSSSESTIAEFTPTGAFVREIALPTGVTALSGIGSTSSAVDVWVGSNGGNAWRLGGAPGCGSACDILPFCSGDTSVTDCPCGNVGAPRHGCASSVSPVGGQLVGVGQPRLSADTLVLQGSDMPNSSALYFQGTTPVTSGQGAVFGDGLRCATTAVVRLRTQQNAAGSSQYPDAGDPAVSVRGGVTVPGVRIYQVWYRNAAAFCTVSTFNLTNAVSVTWGA